MIAPEKYKSRLTPGASFDEFPPPPIISVSSKMSPSSSVKSGIDKDPASDAEVVRTVDQDELQLVKRPAA